MSAATFNTPSAADATSSTSTPDVAVEIAGEIHERLACCVQLDEWAARALDEYQVAVVERPDVRSHLGDIGSGDAEAASGGTWCEGLAEPGILVEVGCAAQAGHVL